GQGRRPGAGLERGGKVAAHGDVLSVGGEVEGVVGAVLDRAHHGRVRGLGDVVGAGPVGHECPVGAVVALVVGAAGPRVVGVGDEHELVDDDVAAPSGEDSQFRASGDVDDVLDVGSGLEGFEHGVVLRGGRGGLVGHGVDAGPVVGDGREVVVAAGAGRVDVLLGDGAGRQAGDVVVVRDPVVGLRHPGGVERGLYGDLR